MKVNTLFGLDEKEINEEKEKKKVEENIFYPCWTLKKEGNKKIIEILHFFFLFRREKESDFL